MKGTIEVCSDFFLRLHTYLDYRFIVLEPEEFKKVTNLLFSGWDIEDAVNYVMREMA